MKKLTFLLCMFLCACVTVPVDDAGKPVVVRKEATVIDPVVRDKVKIGKEIWCSNLKNTRRITLRFIRMLDPEWQSICGQ